MSERFEKVLSIVVGVAALAVAGIVVKREFSPKAAIASNASARPTGQLANWKSLLPAARLSDSALAPVVIVAFSDFECPFCKLFHQALRAVQQKHPGKITLAFVHYPIPSHRFAKPAARAAECAFAQGKFQGMIDALFAAQDSLGLKTWTDYGRTAGIADTALFRSCVASQSEQAFVDRGTSAGKSVGVSGTPTILVNGWRLGAPPDEASLDEAVTRILAGKSAY